MIKPEYLRHLKHDLILRRYQIAAMDEIARRFDGERQAQIPFRNGNWHRKDVAMRCAHSAVPHHTQR